MALQTTCPSPGLTGVDNVKTKEQGPTAPIGTAISLGIIAGMRTMSAPAISSIIISRTTAGNADNLFLRIMQSKKTAAILSLAACGEFVGDKLPTTPNRIALPGLIPRFLSGTLAGAGVYSAKGKKPVIGALIGGTTAIAATFGSFYLRRYIVDYIKLPDAYIGGIEDAIVVASGIALVENSTK